MAEAPWPLTAGAAEACVDHWQMAEAPWRLSADAAEACVDHSRWLKRRGPSQQTQQRLASIAPDGGSAVALTADAAEACADHSRWRRIRLKLAPITVDGCE